MTTNPHREQALNILGDLDLQILHDITEAEGSTEEEPITIPCFSVGWPQELGAGLWGGSVDLEGNHFLDETSLYCWVVNNETALRKEFPDE